MHGITDINTEEGLTHIEEYYSYFNRFDECCRAFLKEQQDFFRYTRTHTVSGTMNGHTECTVVYRTVPALTEAERKALIPAVTVWGGTLTFGTGSADITAATTWSVDLPALGMP